MKARTLSTVAMVMLHPDLRRPTNFPSFSASLPNVVGGMFLASRNASTSESKNALVSIILTVMGHIPCVKHFGGKHGTHPGYRDGGA
jgi:hypothetical protein